MELEITRIEFAVVTSLHEKNSMIVSCLNSLMLASSVTNQSFDQTLISITLIRDKSNRKFYNAIIGSVIDKVDRILEAGGVHLP